MDFYVVMPMNQSPKDLIENPKFSGKLIFTILKTQKQLKILKIIDCPIDLRPQLVSPHAVFGRVN